MGAPCSKCEKDNHEHTDPFDCVRVLRREIDRVEHTTDRRIEEVLEERVNRRVKEISKAIEDLQLPSTKDVPCPHCGQRGFPSEKELQKHKKAHAFQPTYEELVEALRETVAHCERPWLGTCTGDPDEKGINTVRKILLNRAQSLLARLDEKTKNLNDRA